MSDRVPEGWIRIDLEDGVSELISGQSPNRKETPASGDAFGILKTTAIDWGKFDESKNQEVLDDFNPNTKHLVKVDDILITKAGPAHRVGVVALARNIRSKVLLSGKMTAIRVNEKLEPSFLAYALCQQDAQNHLKANTTGMASSQTNFTHDALLRVPILLPYISEQKKIASILASVDEVIENTQKQIDKLQDLKKATMNELLTKGIGHTDFKDCELGRIPKSWRCQTIQQLLDSTFLFAVKDGNHGAQYPRTNEFQKSGVPFLAASNISENGDFNVAKLPCLSLERAATLRIPNAKGGDVILTHNATVGRVTIIPECIDEIIASTSTTYYRANPSFLHNHYLRDFFEGLPFQNQLGRIMGQTTRNQVPITAQKQLYVILPNDILEQQKISEIISAIRMNLALAEKQLAAHMALKKSLMQDLLTGKVRVQVN